MQRAKEITPSKPKSRVLIVDDQEVNRSALSMQLACWGYETAAANSGTEALLFLEAAYRVEMHIDAVILDDNLPDLHGRHLIRTIKENPRICDVPIVFLIGAGESNTDPITPDPGSFSILTRPMKPSVLKSELARIIAPEETLSSGGSAGKTQSANSDIDVLVCEDSKINQVVIRQILDQTNFKYAFAENGFDGVEMYQKFNPRAILMDVTMPVLDGLAATRSIREIETHTNRHVPIVGIATHAIHSDEAKCKEAGMDDYLSKPLSPRSVCEKLDLWLAAPQMAGAA